MRNKIIAGIVIIFMALSAVYFGKQSGILKKERIANQKEIDSLTKVKLKLEIEINKRKLAEYK